MGERYLTAEAAAGELGVSVRTLYAYVSRGLIRSEAVGGSRRNRRYRAEDVRHLRERKERRRDPDRVADGALDWGVPVLESGITLVADGKLFYRGRDVVRLASEASAEEVAALIWTGDTVEAATLFSSEADIPERMAAVLREAGDLPPIEAFTLLLPLVATGDPAAYDLRSRAVARTGARILRLMVDTVAGASGPGLVETLRRGWALADPEAAELLNVALVLCADHELPVSTFAARCVASSGATPYAVVGAGLAALGGVRHGGQVELVEAFLREVEAAGGGREARKVVSGRLRRGDGVPGFGHSLYPEGDPRGTELIRRTTEACPHSPAVALCASVVETADDLLGERPTIDLGLVVLARALGLPQGGAIALFALGRTIGWIGHAIEQYQSGALIRPRAKYVGDL